MGRRLGFLILLLSAFACRADWPTLERFQETITRPEFDNLLTNVYCPSAALTYGTNSVILSTNFTLRFGSALVPRPSPLRRIVLDPGHIGGEWARMEERFFVRGKDRPVQEAVLNLTVARHLQRQLEAAGITVLYTKADFQPVTTQRPADFRTQAEGEVGDFANYPENERVAAQADAARKRAEQLFYRSAEINARARLVNEQLKPDLTICLHFNAVAWNEHNDLVDENRLVVFVHGNYLPSEFAEDNQKLRLFTKLLERTDDRELPVAQSVATALAKATGLPPVQYPTGRVSDNPYVFARNLAANRLFDGPVIYLEPYYMNNKLVYQRLQLGDYDGEKVIDGKAYRSIFREYADAVFEGLRPFLK